MQHTILIEGQRVRRAGSTLMQAAEEYAKEHQGSVGFFCPNYAVVVTHSRKEGVVVHLSKDSEEVTIWMK